MEITVIISDPDTEATEENLWEWLAFKLGYSGCISLENPLHEEDLNISDFFF